MRDRLRLAAIVTAALLALCAIPDARPAAADAVADEVTAASLTAAAALPAADPAIESLEAHLTRLAAAQPEMPLAELVRRADEALDKHGLTYQVVIKDATPGQECAVAAEGVDRFALAGPEIAGSPLCNDNVVCSFRAKQLGRTAMQIIERDAMRGVPIPPNIVFAQALVVHPKDGSILGKFPLPSLDASRLSGVAADKRSVFWRLELGDQANEWWTRVRAREPRLKDEPRPYLALRIAYGSIAFEPNSDLMRTPPDKRPPSSFPLRFGGWPHAAFTTRGLLVLFHDPCG